MTTLAINKRMIWGSIGNITTPASYSMSWDNSLIDQYLPHSNSASSRIDNALSFIQSQGITIENSNIVEDYLKNNYGILAHLYDLPQKINQYFGNAVLNFGAFSDPDIEEEPELYIEIETSLSPEKANQKLSLINKEWLFSSEDNDLMNLNITLKFS